MKIHKIDPILVQKTIEDAVLKIEENRLEDRYRDPNFDYDSMYDDWVAIQLVNYSDVKIIEDEAGFRLVYAEGGHGTGPFRTLERATEWFLNQGR